MSKAHLGLIMMTIFLAGAGCAPTPAAPPPSPTATAPAEVETQGGLVERPVIRITDDGFEPKELTVKKGETVLFVNEGSAPHWPASGPHPTHTNYPEFDPKAGVAPGQTWEFTFEKAGAWPFHDHLNATHFGKIMVTE